jgi:hypothetical protein
MSIDSPVADDLIVAPQQSARPVCIASGLPVGILGGISPLLFIAVALLIGTGVIAAFVTGANVPLSLLVGYCALVGTIAVIRDAVPAAQPREAVTFVPLPTEPRTAAAWKLVNTFTISDASRLLCNIEPGAAATQESIAWGRALIDAIKRGDLAIAPKTGAAQSADRERESPHYMTEVTRDALRLWADQKGSTPAFLRG